MEKIKFFRPRCIEHDGSISVGFWMCENKKLKDGYFYHASEVDALLAEVRALVETTKTARVFLRQFGQHKNADRVDKAIAAVEARMKEEK